MQEQQNVQVKRFFGLKVARTIFQLLALLGAFLCILGLISVVIAAVQKTPFDLNATLGASFGDLLIRTLLFYTAYQIIDVVLSINDSLRKLTQQPRPEPKADDDDPGRQTNDKKIVRILEQHHRRLDSLEKERKS